MSEPVSGAAVTVYAVGRRSGVFNVAFFGLCAALCLGWAIWVIVGAVEHRDYFGLAFGCAAALAGWWFVHMSSQFARARRQHEPYLRLDGEGIECARGRFSWSDIERIAEVRDEKITSLVFVLRAGTAPSPVEGPYLDGFDKEVAQRKELRAEHASTEVV